MTWRARTLPTVRKPLGRTVKVAVVDFGTWSLDTEFPALCRSTRKWFTQRMAVVKVRRGDSMGLSTIGSSKAIVIYPISHSSLLILCTHIYIKNFLFNLKYLIFKNSLIYN